MSLDLLARKGEANPATTHHGGESRFQARRVIVLPPIALHRGVTPEPVPHASVRRAASMTGTAKPREKRKKFTFRIEPVRHRSFCAAADMLGISRQELLTRALDAYLDAHAISTTPQGPVIPTNQQLPFEGMSPN